MLMLLVIGGQVHDPHQCPERVLPALTPFHLAPECSASVSGHI